MNRIIANLKSIRNHLYISAYCRLKSPGGTYAEFKDGLKNKAVVATIAFQQPWVIDWLLKMWGATVQDAILLIADNSKNKSIRDEIKAICARHGAPYIALPLNMTRHANRSHAMAMQWVYRNVFLDVQPDIFGFIDHDLIPIKRISIRQKLSSQPVYGLYRGGYVNRDGARAWNLWAGYCFFRFYDIANINLDFLYDFSLNLDTGGMNYHRLYKNIQRDKVKLAASTSRSCKVSGFEDYNVQIVDEDWYHVGSISYNDNLSKKVALVSAIQNNINFHLPFF